MKKIFTYLFIGSFLYTFAQLPVSQTAEKKNVLLEEFTGKTCGFCPDGHKIAAGIKADNPGDVFLINIHEGSYAAGTPNYRTTEGPAIVAQAQVAGFPAGTINRHYFGYSQSGSPTGATAVGRGSFVTAANTALTEDAYVNVSAEASIDVVTNTMTVNVEAYYTGNSPVSTNKLHVALTQDNIMGPQSGAATYWPEMIDPATGLYRHMHMFRGYLTGQWGEDITTTTMGTLVERTYTYDLPAMLGDVERDITSMHVVVFVTEGNQEVQNAGGATPTLANLPNALEAEAMGLTAPAQSCDGVIKPTFSVRNFGEAEISTMDIRYSVNGGTEFSTTWDAATSGGNILPGYTEDIVMPEIGFAVLASNDLEIRIASVNGATDDVTTNNASTATITSVEEVQTSEVTIDLTYDQYGSEVSWRMLDSNGDVIDEAAVGTYADVAGGGTDTKNITLSAFDCHTFEVNDTYGDGGATVVITDVASGTVLHTTTGSYTFNETYKFANVDANGEGAGNGDGGSVNPNSIKTTNPDVTFEVYPNPATERLVVKFEGEVESIEILNVLGAKVIVSTENVLNVSNLEKGVYFVQLTDKAGNTVSQSFVKK